jgi:hypothetical protein
MLKEEVLQITQQLVISVEGSLSENESGLGLLSGLSGKLLFLYEASKVENLVIDESKFEQHLSILQNNIYHYANDLTFGYGVIGIGWFLEYINQEQEQYDPILLNDVDAIIHDKLRQSPWQGEVEMLIGLAGLSVYSKRRAKRTNQDLFYKRFLSSLDDIAVKSEHETITWKHPKSSVFNSDKNNSNEFNLGLAHGVPGIIASTLQAIESEATRSQAKNMLIKSCDWLIAQKSTEPDKVGSFFSYTVGPKVISRLGWCYGDLPIAVTLARVGKALSIPRYTNLSKEIITHASARDLKSGSVYDAGLCHGTAGIALLFSEFDEVIGQEFIAANKASNFWLAHTLKMYRENGLNGFNAFDGKSNQLKINTGFLIGYSGVGLFLLSTLTGNTNWADCLLIK